jgi:hypothetical protein
MARLPLVDFSRDTAERWLFARLHKRIDAIEQERKGEGWQDGSFSARG